MKILAVGSEGNIGAPLVEHLRGKGHEVYTTDIRPGHRSNYSMADINQPLDLLDAFDWGPQVVYLMAAVVSRVTCELSSSLAISTNVAGANNIITLSRRVGAKVVFFSTSEVYGPHEGIMDEDLTVPWPNNRYGLTKYLGEKLVEYEVQQNGLGAVIVRPFMFYGEDETLGDHRSAMIRFAQRLHAGQPIEVHLGTKRSWLHMSDAVVALERVMELDDFHVLNIGHPEMIETSLLAEKIRHRFGASPELIRLVEQPERMTPVKIPSLQKQHSLLHLTPRVGIEEGIERVCRRFAG